MPGEAPSGPDKRFRVAFSFAGEKRDYVAKVAAILAERFGEDRILYDKYHEAEFGRADLGVHYLPDLYHDQSELVVVVVCPNYDEKAWTGLEWRAIQALLLEKKAERVMLCRFEHATVKGIYENAGWIELDDKLAGRTATQILERLAIAQGKPKSYYLCAQASKPLKSPIPNNLPRIQSFFGRDKELAQIREALDPENRTWGALIDGPGGMGKTSLAVRAAYDCTADQFKRIIFLSVKARELEDEGERELTGFILPGFLEMLNELARELERSDIPKSSEDQRTRLLLEALRSTQTLLILDNLESLPKSERDQLFTFVKRLPQGCKAILTSRRRIGSGSEELILEQLDQVAALATLADLARHNKLLAKTSEAERIQLYEKTGGKPLLLRWLAGQLGRGSCRTLADALHFLGTCPPNNDPLEFIFGDLVGEFTQDETVVLCALTYFTQPAKLEHIATVAGLDKDPTETALHCLTNRSLVVPDQEETAFALVPMVAEFLRRRRPDVVTQTGDRLEKHAYTLIVENGYEQHDCFPMLDAAWPTVAPAMALFAAGQNDRLQTVCNALYWFLDFSGRWDERLWLAEQAEKRAVAAGDYTNAGWRACETGHLQYSRGQGDIVMSCAKRAAEHWKEARAGAREQAYAIRLQGAGHQAKENYSEAVATYKKALDQFAGLSADSHDVAMVLNDLADVEQRTGDLVAAERDYREGLRVANLLNNKEAIATFTGNLASLAFQQEDWASAEKLARESLSLSERIGRQELVASSCGCLAATLARQGSKTEGVSYARRAVDIYTKLRSPEVQFALAALRECEE